MPGLARSSQEKQPKEQDDRIPAAKNQLSRVVERNPEGSFRERIDPNGMLPEEFFDGLVIDTKGVPELKKFNLKMIPVDATVVNFGMRRTGKSTLARHILYEFRNEFPRALVMSDTDALNRFYRKYVPTEHIIRGVNKKILHNVLQLQKKFMKLLLDEYESLDNIPEELLLDCRLLIVADDVIQNEEEIRFNPPLNAVFVNGRHYRVFFLLNTQYEKAIPPNMRNNVDVAFMFYCENIDAVDHLWRLFGSSLDKKMFGALLYKYTRNYMTLVSVRSTITQSLALNNRLFWFRADKNLENKKFEIGEGLRPSQRDYQFTPVATDE